MAMLCQQLPQDSGASFVKFLISSNVTHSTVEKRYRRDISIGELKCKLELVTGCDWKKVELDLLTEKGDLVAKLISNDATLADYPVVDGMQLRCTDHSKSLGQFDADDDDLPNFGLSYEEYEKRPNTFLQWLKANKLGRFKERDPEEERQRREEKERQIAKERELAAAMNTGDRCEVQLDEKKLVTGRVRGTVMFVGETNQSPGKWVGVRLDEPFGSTDGGDYFECDEKYGVFVKPDRVTVGDFPELTIDDVDEI